MIPMKGRAGKPLGSAVGVSSPKGKSALGGPDTDQLCQGIADVKLGTSGENNWEVQARKFGRKTQNNSTKSWAVQSADGNAWKHPDVVQKLGMRNSGSSLAPASSAWVAQTDDTKRSAESGTRPSYWEAANAKRVSQTSVATTWNQSSDATASLHCETDDGSHIISSNYQTDPYDDFGNSDELEENDDDYLSDEYDSDSYQMSHETQKSNRLFKAFFDILDKLTIDEITDPTRQWHCPACYGGPGSIDWYKGLQPLISHAKTKGATRLKLHRQFAEVLNEELHRRGASVVPAGEAFGKWEGLYQTMAKDREIVWPPMVVVMNTKLEQDEKEKWIGMGNQELLDYFGLYAAIRARHSYGPQGHRGMSILIFEASAMGYLEAERLHKHFQEQGTDRNAWDRHPTLFYPGGKRQLYGYMAAKEDMEIFNYHSHGKSGLKYEMRSYQEMVVDQIKQMSEDNQQLILYKDKAFREKRRTKALEESFGVVTEKLRKTLEENRIVKQRTKLQHVQNREEMEYQEQFFKDQIKIIHEARDAKEDAFEKLQQEEREKVKEANANASTVEACVHSSEEVAKFIKFQEKEMDDYVVEREKLIKDNEERKLALKQRYMDEVLKLEKELDAQLVNLMNKYTLSNLGG